jgi:hypothetical protein
VLTAPYALTGGVYEVIEQLDGIARSGLHVLRDPARTRELSLAALARLGQRRRRAILSK